MLFGTATRKVFFFFFKYIEICLKSPQKQQKYVKYRLNQIYPSSLRLSILKTSEHTDGLEFYVHCN